MDQVSYFCPHCGAASHQHEVRCHACGEALDARVEHDILLHDRYRILEQVGQGGFGRVYKAADTDFGGRLVAIKEMEQKGLSQEEIMEATDSFKREALMLANLRHPHLPRIYDHFSESGRWYLVMDYLEGETLEAYQERVLSPLPTAKKRFPVEEVLAIGIQLCTVLDYLHTRQPPIIFRDLKPTNIMRTSGQHLYLIDFGIARHFKLGQSKDTIPLGSPGYAAPEQYGKAQTTPRADIYSLGATLHQLLSGDDPSHTPFLLAPLEVHGYNPAHARLAALIQQMTEIDEKNRPSTIISVKEELQRIANWQADKQIWTAPPAEPAPNSASTSQQQAQHTFAEHPERPSQPDPSRRLVVAGLVAGLGLAGLGGSVLAWKQLTSPVVRIRPPLSQPTDVSQPTIAPGDTPTPLPFSGSKIVYSAHRDAVTALAWSPDGAWVASGSADKTVQVWNARDGAVLAYLGYHMPITSVTWSRYGSQSPFIAFAGENTPAVRVYDLEALGSPDAADYTKPVGRVLALDWQKHTNTIVLGSENGRALAWYMKQDLVAATYNGHTGPVKAVAISGNRVASGGADHLVHIWDIQTGNRIAMYKGHTGAINSLVWIADTLLASASDDGSARVWNTLNGTIQAVYTGHKGSIQALAALGTFVLSGGADHLVHIWGYSDGKRYGFYTGHTGPIRALVTTTPTPATPTFATTTPYQPTSSVGPLVASAGDDRAVHVWSLDRDIQRG